MFNIKRGLGLVALAMLFTGSAATAADALTVKEIQERGYITIGLGDTNPPFATLDANMEHAGLEVDLAKLLAESLNVEMRPVTVAIQNRVACLLTGCADVLINSLTITAERAAQVWFTQPYAENVMGVLAPKDTVINSPEDLKALRVGVVRAGAGDPLVTAAAPEGTAIQRYDDPAGVVQAMLAGQIDAMTENSRYPGILNGMQSNVEFENKLRFSAGYWGMVIAQDQPDLLQYLNSFLFTIKYDGKLEALYQTHTNQSAPDLPTF